MDQSQTLNDAIGPAKPISSEMPHNEDPMNHAEAIFISLLHTGTFHAIAVRMLTLLSFIEEVFLYLMIFYFKSKYILIQFIYFRK